MANDKNGRSLAVGESVTVIGSITAISGQNVTVILQNGTVVTVESIQTEYKPGPVVTPAAP